jgi:hypothetical protein
MVDLNFAHYYVVELACGCKIDGASGEINQECLPHREGNFIQ